MIAKVEVDMHTCIGCGTCWVSCPETFKEVEQGEDYKAIATEVLAPERRLREAAEACPSLSISLFDAAGELLFPTEAKRAERQRLQQCWRASLSRRQKQATASSRPRRIGRRRQGSIVRAP